MESDKPSDLEIKPRDPFSSRVPTSGPLDCLTQTCSVDGPSSFPLASVRPVAGESSAGFSSPPGDASRPAAGTSLDTQESTVKKFLEAGQSDALPPTWEEMLKLQIGEPTYAERFRHSGWWPIRRRVMASLYRTRQTDSRIRNFCTCGRAAWIQRSDVDSTRFRVCQNNCHDRLCTPCALTRSFQIRQALYRHCEGKKLKFITLTLLGKGESLVDLVDRLYRSFRALRIHPSWADRIAGGAAFLEIKWNEKKQRWHPHLHILCEGKYFPQHELSSVWRGITHDSFIVHLRPVGTLEKDTGYITKYASKALDSSFALSPARLDEAVVALKGRRLCLCFGTWYGTPLSMAEDEQLADDLVDASGWSNFSPLEEILVRADQGDAYCRHILASMRVDAKWIMARELDTS